MNRRNFLFSSFLIGGLFYLAPNIALSKSRRTIVRIKSMDGVVLKTDSPRLKDLEVGDIFMMYESDGSQVKDIDNKPIFVVTEEPFKGSSGEYEVETESFSGENCLKDVIQYSNDLKNME